MTSERLMGDFLDPEVHDPFLLNVPDSLSMGRSSPVLSRQVDRKQREAAIPAIQNVLVVEPLEKQKKEASSPLAAQEKNNEIGQVLAQEGIQETLRILEQHIKLYVSPTEDLSKGKGWRRSFRVLNSFREEILHTTEVFDERNRTWGSFQISLQHTEQGDDETLLELIRPQCFRGPQCLHLQMFTAKDEYIGGVKTNTSVDRGLFEIKDDQNEVIYRFAVLSHPQMIPFLFRDASIVKVLTPEQGVEAARMTKHWAGTSRAMDNYDDKDEGLCEIEFCQDLSPQHKALVLGACLLMERTVFEEIEERLRKHCKGIRFCCLCMCIPIK